jgi:hypothetical protein
VQLEALHLVGIGIAEHAARDEIVGEADVDHTQVVAPAQVVGQIDHRVGEDVGEQHGLRLPVLVRVEPVALADELGRNGDRFQPRVRNDAVDARGHALLGSDDAGDVRSVVRLAVGPHERRTQRAARQRVLDVGIVGEPDVDNADLGARGCGVGLAVAIDQRPHGRHADRLQTPVAVRRVAGLPAPSVGRLADLHLRPRRLAQRLVADQAVDERGVHHRLLAQRLDQRRIENAAEPFLGIGHGLQAARAFFHRRGGFGLLDRDDAERADDLGDLEVELRQQRLDLLFRHIRLQLDHVAVFLGDRDLRRGGRATPRAHQERGGRSRAIRSAESAERRGGRRCHERIERG